MLGAMATRLHMQGDALVVQNTQDCTAIAEHATARRNEGKTGSSEMRLAASIPVVFVEKYLNDNGITYAEFAQDPAHKVRLLNNPDLAHFRVWEGRC